MATITKLTATPNCIRYHVEGDLKANTTASFTMTGAASPDLITDSVAGPLRRALQKIAAGVPNTPYGAGSDVFNAFFAGTVPGVKATELGIYAYGSTGVNPPVQGDGTVGVQFDIDGSANPLLNLGVAQLTNTVLEIRFLHSMTR